MASKAATCRQCRTSLAGCTYLQIALGTLPDGGKLCLTCIDRGLQKYGTATTHEFVVRYIKEHKPDTVRTLKARVEELERLLEGLTDPLKVKP